MTKLRPPVSIENKLLSVLGELGVERAAEVTGRIPGYLHAVTDPDREQQLTVRDLIALDLACRAAGDHSFPLYETVGLILEAESAERFACFTQLGRLAGETSREGGEACAALIEVAFGADRDPVAITAALRQAEEARESWTDAVNVLRSFLPLGQAP